MDDQSLKALRTRQYVLMNGNLIGTVLIFLGMKSLQVPLSIFFLISSSIIFILTLFEFFSGYPLFYRLFSLRALIDYEKGKLGSEWKKSKRLQFAAQLIIAVFLLFQGLKQETGTLNAFPYPLFMFIVLVVALFSNLTTHVHHRKVDRLNPERAIGFTVRHVINAIWIGLVIGIFSTLAIFLGVIAD